MPKSIIEAKAMNNGIIATNIRDSGKKVDHSDNGYLVNLNEPNQIRKCVQYLVSDKDKLRIIQKNARTQSIYIMRKKW